MRMVDSDNAGGIAEMSELLLKLEKELTNLMRWEILHAIDKGFAIGLTALTARFICRLLETAGIDVIDGSAPGNG